MSCHYRQDSLCIFICFIQGSLRGFGGFIKGICRRHIFNLHLVRRNGQGVENLTSSWVYGVRRRVHGLGQGNKGLGIFLCIGLVFRNVQGGPADRYISRCHGPPGLLGRICKILHEHIGPILCLILSRIHHHQLQHPGYRSSRIISESRLFHGAHLSEIQISLVAGGAGVPACLVLQHIIHGIIPVFPALAAIVDSHYIIFMYPFPHCFPGFNPLRRVNEHGAAVIAEHGSSVAEGHVNQIVLPPHRFPSTGASSRTLLYGFSRLSQVLPCLNGIRPDACCFKQSPVIVHDLCGAVSRHRIQSPVVPKTLVMKYGNQAVLIKRIILVCITVQAD